MTIYGRIIKEMGLGGESQGKYGHWWLMLSALDAYETANPSADTEANPWAELLRRLGAYRDSPAYKELAQEIGTRAEYNGRNHW